MKGAHQRYPSGIQATSPAFRPGAAIHVPYAYARRCPPSAVRCPPDPPCSSAPPAARPVHSAPSAAVRRRYSPTALGSQSTDHGALESTRMSQMPPDAVIMRSAG